MPSPTQLHRNISFASPLGADKLLIQSATITEQVGRPFEIDVVLQSTDINIQFDKIIGTNSTIRLEMADRRTRFFNGFVNRFTLTDVEGPHLARYRATLVPWLWLLTRTSDCRIFQNKSVPDIIKEVFRDHGFNDFKDKLTGNYLQWEYCVQYRETAFNFVSRMMEQEGIYYFFEHTNGKHTLVMCDNQSAHAAPTGYRGTVFRPDAVVRDKEVVSHWTREDEVEPGNYCLSDFNFKKPRVSLQANYSKPEAHEQASFEMFDFPGEYDEQSEGSTYSRVRLEEMKSQHMIFRGASNDRDITTGYKCSIKEFPRSDFNGDFLVISATCHLTGDDYTTGATSAGDFFTCNFTAIQSSQPYRSSRITPKPLVQGPQTAIVVGPSGEEVHTDEYGRIKVQFHWDRYGKADQNASCWIRVSQAAWAGKKWGAMYIPRIGQEVIVEFLEGDPDLPIVTGRVYNADCMPPYDLPAEKTKTTLKSNSSKGGQGFNEIRFEDKKGKEQVFIHAERNQDVRVKKDSFEYVGDNRHLFVKKDQFESITGDKHLSITGEQNEKIGETLSINVGQNIQEKAGMRIGAEAGQEIHLKAGMSIIIEAGTSITLKAGGGFIVVGPAGVTISGTPVLINSGGSAGSGSGCSPTAPKAAIEADKAQPGSTDQAATRTPARIKPTRYGPTAVTLKQAAQSGTPFCEQCAKAAAGGT